MHTPWDKIRQDILALGESPASLHDYRSMLLDHLRQAVPFDAACLTAVDPQTLLSTGAVTDEDIERIHHQLFENEYLHEDFNKYSRLAKALPSASALSHATNGRLERSLRYRGILRPAGWGDELRAALVCEDSCWGYVTLFRRNGRPLFMEEECSFLSSLTPAMAKAMRKKILASPVGEAEGLQMETGILLLSGRLVPLSANQAAERWLDWLRSREGLDARSLPRPILAVCFRAQAAAASDPAAKVCIRTPNGQFLAIRATRLSGDAAAGQLAVWFETARPADMLPLLADAYGFSPREKDVFERVLRGSSTKDISRSLHISGYTVQDHLKSIFAKTGVTSRRDLIGEIWARFSFPQGS